MKLKSTLLGGVLCAASLGLQAQNSVEMPNVTIFGNTPGITEPNGEIYGPVTRFTEFIGMDVYNFQNERLGEIRSITADLSNARIVEVFISATAGFFGPGQIVTPVPPTALTFDGRREIARLNVSKARFDAAAKIRVSDVAVYSQPERVAANSRYFGREPWFAYSGQKAGRPRLGYVQTTDTIHRLSIRNPQGRYMGKVGTLVMDLPRGQITRVVNSTSAMGGTGNHLLQPQALRYNARYDGLVLNQTFTQLKDQPKLVWADGRSDSFVAETNAAQNAQARPATPVLTGRLAVPYLSSPRQEVRRAQSAR